MAPLDIGPCKASILRWYFDSDDNSCKDFIFGGCDGNTNNFATKEKCERTCSKFVVEEGDSANCFSASDKAIVFAAAVPIMQTPASNSFLASVSVMKTISMWLHYEKIFIQGFDWFLYCLLTKMTVLIAFVDVSL